MSASDDARTDERGLFARAAHTPMRDAVRFRISGRLDVRHLLATSDLPKPLQILVHRVVGATRLWRIEKVDVARELVAHFADGLAAGASPERLSLDFGDPDEAAILIRRAKKRSRPLMWKGARFTLFGIAALVVLYAALIVYFALGRPNIATDYLAQINQTAAAAAEGDRGWPHYRAALMALEEAPDAIRSGRAKPGEEGWDDLAAYIGRNDDALALARRAAAQPALGFIVSHRFSPEDAELWPVHEREYGNDDPLDGVLYAVLLPHLAELRRLSGLLEGEARLAASDGDGELFLDNIRAILNIAVHCREHPFIISDLVTLAIFASAFELLADHLESHPGLFSERALVDLAHVLSASASEGNLRVRLEGERLVFADFMQRIYTDDGRGSGRLTPHGVRALEQVGAIGAGDVPLSVWAAAPAAALALANRRDMAAKYDEFFAQLLAEAAMPLWKRSGSFDRLLEAEMSRSALVRMRYMPIFLLMPALEKATVTSHIVAQRRDGVLSAIALKLHHRQYGRWPASLEELTPRYLPAVPIDRFDGRPMRYTVRGNLPIVYSVGTNREDDGGVPAIGRRGYPDPDEAMRWIPAERIDRLREQDQRTHHHVPMVPDGDWVLWPRLSATWEHPAAPNDAALNGAAPNDGEPPHVDR